MASHTFKQQICFLKRHVSQPLSEKIVQFRLPVQSLAVRGHLSKYYLTLQLGPLQLNWMGTILSAFG